MSILQTTELKKYYGAYFRQGHCGWARPLYIERRAAYYLPQAKDRLHLPELQSGSGVECLRKYCVTRGAGRKQDRQEVYERSRSDTGAGG